MFQTFIVGLGRSGQGLHLPVLSRLRSMVSSRHLFNDRPIVAFDPYRAPAEAPGVVFVRSLAEAAVMVEPKRTIVHLCSPPATHVELLEQLVACSFRKIVVEKPLAVDEHELAKIDELRRRWNLRLAVVTPWLASALTDRILDTVCDGKLGALESVFVVQRKPRFTRTFVERGHPTAFDIEMPHSVGVALAIAGDATMCDARLTDMEFGDVVFPRMGSAWLLLGHRTGVSTEILSDLTAPTRERRITLKFAKAALIGYYANSEADHTAHLITVVGQRETHSVFHDDALATFFRRTYEHFAAGGPDGDSFTLNAAVVRLLSEAKRISMGPETANGVFPCSHGGKKRESRAY